MPARARSQARSRTAPNSAASIATCRPFKTGPAADDDERGTLLYYLRRYRLTLEMKCADLDAEQLARRSVPPSTMSLLGLVRHLAMVEPAPPTWALPAPRRYRFATCWST